MSGHTIGDVVMTSLFAYGLMATIALATAGFIAALVAGLAAMGRKAAPAAVATPAAAHAAAPSPTGTDGVDPAVVAAIAAAVHTVIGAHRIVYIGEAPAMGGWTGEVRQRHHGSHHPHHER